ncbi:MAG: DUF2283 domain-containing protein [bacterium]|nr:DUF2283 domain-containing protein [bacterium]
MAQPTFHYDEPGDTLFISFQPGKKATGVELNEHILLRIDRNDETAVGITIFDYSLVAQKTEMGPRSFPLDGLSELSGELRELVLRLLRRPPVSDVLAVSTYTPSMVKNVPITSLQSLPIAARE